MAIGKLAVRIILTKNDEILKNGLPAAGFGVTSVDGEGIHSPVKLIFPVIRRKDLEKVIRIINESHSNAFYSVGDARTVARGGTL